MSKILRVGFVKVSHPLRQVQQALRQHFLLQETVPRTALPMLPEKIPDLAAPVNKRGTHHLQNVVPHVAARGRARRGSPTGKASVASLSFW
jgi:hypothetical protein